MAAATCSLWTLHALGWSAIWLVIAISEGMPLWVVALLYGPGSAVSFLLNVRAISNRVLIAVASLSLINSCAIPRTIPNAPVLIAVFALQSLFTLAKAMQMVRRRSHYMKQPIARRMCQSPGWFVIASAHDTAIRDCAPGSFDVAVLCELVAASAGIAAAVFAVRLLPPIPISSGVSFGAVAWAHAAALACSAVAGLHLLDAQFRAVWLLCGVRLAPMMHSPWLSCSLREFWGKRFDRMIGSMLSDLIYKPALSYGAPRTSAILLVFAVSGFVHSFPVLMGAGSVQLALAVAAFFVSQALLIMVEASEKSIV